jgi:hypothetical protein
MNNKKFLEICLRISQTSAETEPEWQ